MNFKFINLLWTSGSQILCKLLPSFFVPYCYKIKVYSYFKTCTFWQKKYRQEFELVKFIRKSFHNSRLQVLDFELYNFWLKKKIFAQLQVVVQTYFFHYIEHCLPKWIHHIINHMSILIPNIKIQHHLIYCSQCIYDDMVI